MGTLPYPGDQLIDAAMAHALHADACRNHAAVAWVVLWDLPAYPKRYAARLATSGPVPSPYLRRVSKPGHTGGWVDAGGAGW
jgi:hypothetical protein